MAMAQKSHICLFNADLNKAFDMLSWDFIIKMLQANPGQVDTVFGFARNISSTVKFSGWKKK
jgi:hypothetical protein